MTKLIFCFDGTSNEPDDNSEFFTDTSITNILKMHGFLGGKLNPLNGKNNNTPGQHSFYYSGIGTYGGFIRRVLNKLIALPYMDMDYIITNATQDLEKHFQEGDEIFIFGFSRGAAIARIFAAKLGDEQKPIKFLGVFDTVSATKDSLVLHPDTLPASAILFENGTIGEHIESAVHLVALDERRITFQPTLFNKDERIAEVWFAGSHSDIGGGFWFDGLADITLNFMCEQATRAGLEFLGVEDLDYQVLNTEDSAHEEAIGIDDMFINPLPCGEIHEQSRSQTLALTTLAPRSFQVNVNDRASLDKGDIPIVHHTVRERFKGVTGYRPCSMRNTHYRIIDANGNLGGPRIGVAMLGNPDDVQKNA